MMTKYLYTLLLVYFGICNCWTNDERNVTEYQVITGITVISLELSVNASLAEGWNLIGGVTFDYSNKEYCQAVAR